MKTAKRLIPLLVVILAIMAFGCFHSEKRAVKKAIKNDLDLLKNLDSDTASKYFSYKELFPDIKDDQKQSNEIKDVFPLFFQDFDYKILDVDVDKDKTDSFCFPSAGNIGCQCSCKGFYCCQATA